METSIKGGWMGNILSVDLTKQTISTERLDPEMAKKYIGGVGFGIKIAYDEILPGMDAYDEETPLVFVTGPLTGTSAPSSAAYSVVTKSPLTGITLAMGNANGFFGLRLKSAGYDAVIVRGKSEKPVYLWINDGKVEFRDATGVWGARVSETEARLKEEVGQKGASVACIGPAGENLVKYAAICGDFGHIIASGGIGAVMGSKNLKAIVANGTQKTPVCDEEKLKEICQEWVKAVSETHVAQGLKAYGTGGSLEWLNNIGDVPTKNFTTNISENIGNLTGITIRNNFNTKVKPCYKCPINHVHKIEFIEGEHCGVVMEEPEYEGIAATGTNIGINETEPMLYLHHLIDDYGMDIKTVTFVISLCMECYEKGLLTQEQLDGLELTWGNAAAVEELLGKISRREGVGNILAESIKTVAEYIGGDAPDRAVHVRGAGIHLHDLRAFWGFFLAHVVSPFAATFSATGGDFGADPEFGPPMHPFKSDGQAKALKLISRKHLLTDCLTVCTYNFPTVGIHSSVVVNALNAITGENFTIEEIWESMEAIENLARAFNIRHGLTAEDDWASERLLQEPVDGPVKGISNRTHLKGMVHDYYREMGWDEKTGKPLRRTLKSLGLESVAKDLWD